MLKGGTTHVLYLDSFFDSCPEHIARVLLKATNCLSPAATALHTPATVKQTNGDDCGIHVLDYMERLIVKLSSFENFQKQSRVPISESVTLKKIAAFASETMEGQKRHHLIALFHRIRVLAGKADQAALDKVFQTYASAQKLAFKSP